MNDKMTELKELVTMLGKHAEHLDDNVQAIEAMLGSPAAKEFSEETISDIVDQVLRYNMMIRDIVNFIDRRLEAEIKDTLLEAFSKMTMSQTSAE